MQIGDGLAEKLKHYQSLGVLRSDGTSLRLQEGAYFSAGEIMRDLSLIPLNRFCSSADGSDTASDITDNFTPLETNAIYMIKNLFASARRNESVFKIIVADVESALEKFGIVLEETLKQDLIKLITSGILDEANKELCALDRDWRTVVEQYR